MSRLRFNNLGTNPPAPAVGKTEIFVAPDGKLKQIDSNGVITNCTQSSASVLKVSDINTGTTTYTPTIGTASIYVECIGAGGGGGGAATGGGASLAAGGGGGGYSTLFISSPASSYSVSVGTGGTAGAIGGTGGNGGDTTFGASLCVARGGSGGQSGGAGSNAVTCLTGGAGGLASTGTGDTLLNGQHGGSSIRLSSAVGISGRGGDGPIGGGGGQEKVVAGAGNPGLSFGGGGSGGAMISNSASVTGGAGANGLIRVWEFG
jgi:hypothetical protein